MTFGWRFSTNLAINQTHGIVLMRSSDQLQPNSLTHPKTVQSCYEVGVVPGDGDLVWQGNVGGGWWECLALCQTTEECDTWFMSSKRFARFARICTLYGDVTKTAPGADFVMGGKTCNVVP